MYEVSQKLSQSLARELFFSYNLDIDFEFVAITGSTNDDIKALVQAPNLKDRRIVLLSADSQTNGRGTRGRNWKTQADSLLFSIAIPVKKEVSNISLAPIVTGIAVAKSLNSLRKGYSVKLKWPNDLFINGGKFGGILCELVRVHETKSFYDRYLIIGIGINLFSEAKEKTTNGWNIGTLYERKTFSIEERTKLLAKITAEVISSQRQYLHFGQEYIEKEVLNDWESFDAFYQKEVALETESFGIIKGIDLGIDLMGRLKICDGSKINAYSSGSILKHE